MTKLTEDGRARILNNGVQMPIRAYEGGKLIGTEMLYTDGKFDTSDGRFGCACAMRFWTFT